MALRVANLTSTFEFIWDEDPDKDDEAKATVFILGYLDAYDQAYLSDRMTTFESGSMRAPHEGETKEEVAIKAMSSARLETYKAAVDATQMCLKGFRNLQDVDGKPLEFTTVHQVFAGRERTMVDPAIVRGLDSRLCLAIYNRVTQINRLSEKERKNSKRG